MNLFYQNQIDCAEEIVKQFGKIPFGVLKAPMQSGKTGTFHYVAFLMLKKNMVENVFILCATADNMLANDGVKYIYQVSDYLNERDMLHEYEQKVVFYKRNDFTNENTLQSMKNKKEKTLFIMDENHLAQTKGESQDKMWNYLGFNPAGTNADLIQSKSYILNVSATNFAEISDVLHQQSLPKFMIQLVPGNKYKGIQWFYENNKIKPIWNTHDLNDEDNDGSYVEPTEEQHNLKDIILQKGLKYNLIRISSTHKIFGLLNLCKKNNITIYEYNSNYKNIYITKEEERENREKTKVPCDHLEKIPTKPSIVIIRGALRVGKVVPKKYIGFVWEDSNNPKTDTILQSLLGRMCGYHNYHNIDIYISPKIMKNKEVNGISLNELQRFYDESLQMIPQNGKNLKNNLSKNIHNYNGFPTIPFIISKKEFTDNFHLLNVEERKKQIKEKIKENNFKLIYQSIQQTEDVYPLMIQTFKEQEDNMSFRQIGASYGTYEGDFQRIMYSMKMKEPYHGLINKDKFAVLSIEEDGIQGHQEAKKGDIYVFIRIFGTQKHFLISKIPETNKKEIFAFNPSNSIQDDNFIGIRLTIDSEVADNPRNLYIQLELNLKGSNRKTNNSIYISEDFRIPKNKYHWKSIKQNDVMDILHKLQKEYKVKFTINFIDYNQELFQITDISWVFI